MANWAGFRWRTGSDFRWETRSDFAGKLGRISMGWGTMFILAEWGRVRVRERVRIESMFTHACNLGPKTMVFIWVLDIYGTK